MKTLNNMPGRQSKTIALLIFMLAFGGVKSYAQAISGNASESDTVTYVLYDNNLSIDSKRTLVIDDKHSVDSLANVLAAANSKMYRIIYEKQGQQPKLIQTKDLKNLDRTRFFQITIAYNKKNLSEDPRPLYVISGK